MNLPRKRLGVAVLVIISTLLVIGTGTTLIGFSSYKLSQEKLAGILNDSSQFPIQKRQSSLQVTPSVLAAEDSTQSAQINFNAYTFFNERSTFLADIEAIGRILNLGDGEIIASNVIYSLNAGSGITISEGQNPTISAVVPSYSAGTGISVGANNTLTNTGVLSLQGSTGAVTLSEGEGISIDGLEITNDDPGTAQNIFKTIAISGQSDIVSDANTDTLTFSAGSGITLTTDATTDTVTITAAAASGWTDDGSVIRLTDSTDNITIGSASDLAKLGVVGDTSEIQLLIRGNSTQSTNIFEIENSASTNLLTVDNSGNLALATGADLSIGAIGLNDAGSAVTSGASLIGVFDEFNNSNSSNVQDVLDDLDAAVGSGASKWTQGTGLIYVTNTTDSVTVGGTTELGKLAVEGDANQIQLLIRGNGTQTSDLAVFENSSGTDVFNVTNTGNTTLGGNLTVGSDTISDFTGNGLTTATNALTINLPSPTDALSSTITSGSGLEVLASGLTLIQGCSTGQVLKWNETNDSWECANDTGAVAAVVNIENNDSAVGSNVDTLDFSTDFSVTASPSNEANIAIADDVLNFTEFSDSLTLDAATTITNSLAGNFIIDLTSTGDFVVSDAGTPFFTFTDGGALTQAGSGQVTLTGNVDATSGLDVTGASLTVGGNATITTAGAGTFNSTLTADGTLDANALFTLGDGGETGAIDTSDWDISTAGVLTGISGITTDGGYTQSGSTANSFTGATTFSTDVDFTFADTENIALTNTVTGTNALDLLSATLTNQTTSGTQRGIAITNANDAANATTESLLFIDNAETTASTVTDGIRITASGVDAGITDAIDVSDSNLTNAINVGANTIAGTTAVIDFTNFDLDASGNIVVAGTITAATNETINGIDINAGTISDVVNLTINSGGDLAIGAIGLNDFGSSNANSGASLIGTYGEFANSSSTNVQDVLDDLDAAIGAGASKWTDGGTITYLTATTDDLAVGASNTLTAPFSVDVSANLVRIGTGATANAQLDLYGSDGDTGSLIYNTNDQFSFANGDVLVNQALTTTGTLTANGTLDSNGDLSIADTNIALDGASTTFTSTGAFTLTPGGAVLLGDGGDTLQINSSDWDISTTGDLTGIGAITSDGAISFTPGSTSDITFTTDDDSNVVSTTTLTADGASIFDLNLTLGDDADVDAVSALNIDVTSAATGDADNLYAIQIGNLSTLSANVSETAIRIGEDWQNLFEIEGATNDANEFFLIAEDPAADRTYTIPYETSDAEFCLSTGNCAGVGTNGDITAVTAGSGLTGGGASGDVTVNIGAGNGITVNADDITIDLTAATDALSATTSSGSGLEVLASGLTLLQGCSDSQVLTWNESSDIWQCSDIAGVGGVGDISAVGDVSSGPAFTQTAGADGTTLYFEGATTDGNEIALTSADPGSDITVTIPNIAGTLASLAGTQTFTGAKTFDDLTIADTNVALSGATTTLTSTGAFTLTPGGAVLLGDGGDTLQINSSDWDISTTGDLTGIGSISVDGGYTQSGSTANTFSGATAFTGGTTFNTTLAANSNGTQSVSSLTFTTPADTVNTNVNQGFSITPTIGNATGGTNTANIFNIGAVAGDAQVSLNAINIGALTGTAASEYALNIGAGWDSALRVGGTEVINGSGQVITTQLSGTLLTLDGDDADTETLAQGNTLLIAGGTNGIDTDVATTDTITLNLDTTEISDATFGSGSGFTWTFNAGATDPTLAFASDSVTIGSAATLSATSVTTLNCTDCINFDDMSDTLALDASTSIAFDASEVLTFDAATTDTTTTGGVLDLNIDAGNAAVIGLNMDFGQADGATAGTNAIAQRIALSANDADGDVFGLQITGSATANAAAGSYESLLTLTNAENTAGAVTDALLITTTSGTAGDITDAIDASASDITNALNVGANNIIGSTAVINFDNFDVASTGAITVAATQGIDTNAAGALNIGTANATSAVIGSSSLGSLTVTTNGTGDSEVVLPNDSIATAEILDNTLTATDLAATLTFADGDLLDLSGINNSASTEGFRLPQNTNCSSSTSEGQICWDSDTEALYIGNSSGVTLIGGTGGGDITAVGDVTSGDAFTQTAGADGTTLYFEGSTSDSNEIALTSADPGSDITVTIPNIAGTLASLAGTQTFTGAKTFDDLTIADTNISLSGASTTLTSTGAFTLTPGGAVLLGDGGDTLQINSSDWDVSTTGDLTGIGSISADGGYTQSGSTANTFTGATALTGGTTFNRTLGANSGATQSVSDLTFTTPADTTGINVNQGLSITPTIGNATGGTNTANIFNIGAIAGDAQVALNAINIGALTGTGATEYALSIGAGWDSILRVGGTEVINGSGQVITSQLSGSLLTLDGDDADTETLAQGNTLLIAGGTNGIDTDVSASDTVTLNLDTTEISDATFGSGSGFVWTFNAGATDPTLTFASNALTIGSAATVTATDVTTLNCTDCINFDDMSDSLALDASTSIAFDAAEVLTLDAATVDTTTTGGVLDLNIDAGNAAVIGLNMDFGQADGATAGIDAIAQRITLAANDADGDVFGLQITGSATANAAAGSYEAAISIDNAENTAASMTDAILITSSGVSAGITDAIDVSAANINNALNAGANFITFDGIRTFEGATGTLTFEDTSGNDLATLVDQGTTGDLSLTGDLTVSGGDIVSAVSANLLNTTSTTINFAGVATVLNIADSTATSTTDIGGVTADGASTVNIATNATTGDTITIGNSASTTTLALTGGDAWSLSTSGVLTLSADAAQTTAIVATDTDYTNFASIGDNDITGTTYDIIGTTATIDFSNFDVASTGAITVAASTGLDTNGAGALLLGNTNATSVSICNSAACDTLSLGTNADADNINIGDNNDTLVIDTSGFDVSSGQITANTDETINGIDINSGAISDVSSLSISSAASTAIALTRSSSGQWMSFNDGTDTWGIYNTAGTPEGALTANTGALSMDTTNGTLYVKTDDGDATGWVNLATGGSSPWQTTSNVANLVTSTDNVTIGSSTNLAKLSVVGDTDEIQFLVQANGTQTTGLMVLENSGGTDQFTVSSSGAVGIEGAISDITGATVEINDDLQVTGNDILDSASATRISLGSTTTLTNTTTTLSGTTTLNGTSLTTINGGATAIDFTEFDVSASTGAITINDTGDAGALVVEGTNLDINDLTFVGAGTLATGTASNLTIDSGTTGSILLGTDSSAETINLGTGAAAKTVTLGSTNTTSATTIQSGTGDLTLSSGDDIIASLLDNNADALDIQEGSNNYLNINTTNSSENITLSTARATGGDAITLQGNSITTGSAVGLDANALTSGIALDISSTSTALTTGRLASLDWSPGSATSATGDLFRINIGSNGNVGNLFNVTDNSSSLFSISETSITSAIPHSFTAAGDVAVAYDLQFTNQTASYIKSNAPLYIEAGEAFENNDLTLRTFGNGKIITDGGFSIGAQETLTVNSTTPSVGGASHFITANSSATNYTNFTDGVAGQLLVIEVNDANTSFNCIGSEATINCGNLDISAAAGDILTWVYDGTVWNLINWLDEGDTQTGADLAELYVTQEEMDPGTIVMIKGEENPLELVKATQGNTDKAIGAVSTEPHTIMGGNDTQGFTTKPVALAGRIPVKVTTENGDISPGDFITVSSQPGIGAKAINPGMVIGKALSGFSSEDVSEVGTINMFVQNTYFSPITSELAGQNELAPDSLSSTTFPNLLVSGTAEFSNVTVTGEILAGNLSITGLATGGGADITTLTGPLRLQADAANNVEIMGGKVIIDTEGNIFAEEGTLSAKTISAEKVNIRAGNVAGASLGTATINAWQTSVTVDTTAVTENSQIFVTAKSRSRQPLAVTTTVSGSSFTVEVPEEQEEDLVFSWWIIN